MSDPEVPRSPISRPFAAGVLVALLVAGALSAWLVVHGDFARARPEPTSETSGSASAASGDPPTP